MRIAKLTFPFLMTAACAVFFFLYVRIFEKNHTFYPAKEFAGSPQDFGFAFENVYFKTADGLTLHGWFLPQEKSTYTILFAHGNGGNISHRIEKLKLLKELGLAVFIFDYRGYGNSQGSPSEKGIYLDTKAAYDYLLSRGIARDKIIGYGESLGGAAIIDLASKNAARALIIESSFSRASDMIKYLYPFLPVWLFSNRWDSIAKIGAVKSPKLFMHSPEDEIVPFRFGHALFKAAPLPKELLQIKGGHNEGFFVSLPLLKDKIREFIAKL